MIALLTACLFFEILVHVLNFAKTVFGHLNYDLDMTNILVASPQIRYIEVFDITNSSFNEQIWPVPVQEIQNFL